MRIQNTIHQHGLARKFAEWLQRSAGIIALLGIAQFIISVLLAMMLYAGGAAINPQSPGYSFFQNYLSDLGRTTAWSGLPNDAAAIVFNTSIILLGLSLTPFVLMMPTHASDAWPLLVSASVLGLANVVALIVLGLTPYDRYHAFHEMALFARALCLFGMVSLHAWAMATSDEVSFWWCLPSLCMVGLVGWYMLGGGGYSIASAATQSSALERTATLQKTLVGGGLLLCALFAVRTITWRLPVRDDQRRLEVEVERYMRQLARRR